MLGEVIVAVKNAMLLVPNKVTGSVIPHTKQVTIKGTDYACVPHGIEETKVLRNLGYTVPCPILYHYDWAGRTDVYDTQRDTAEMMVSNRYAYVLNAMGTGKTRASLFATDYLLKTDQIDKVLILAPLSTLSHTWEREIFMCFPHRSATSLHHTAKAKRLQRMNEDKDYYVINHDGVKVILKELLTAMKLWGRVAIIIDELAVLRNQKTSRWKAVNKLVSHSRYAWGMTGGPVPKEPTDAYGQIKLLTPSRVPKYFKQFKELTMLQITPFKWIPKQEALDIVYDAMRPSVRYERDDCFDLPPVTEAMREIKLSATQEEVGKKMWDHFVHEDAQGLITAANSAVRIGKLVQIYGGYVYSDNGTIVDLEPEPRLQELEGIIEQSDGKVIVFCAYRHTVDKVQERLEKTFNTGKIYGTTSKNKRDELFTDFQFGSKLEVLVAHPQTMAHGLTLTAANTIVWYQPIMDLEIFDQANARITRAGQKRPQHVIKLVGNKVESAIYKRLQKRSDTQSILLSMLHGENLTL